MEVEEVPETLVIDMGTLQYRTTLLQMIEKVGPQLCACSAIRDGSGHC